eukprot:5328677-Amphidinium_carterae.1
MLGLMEPEQLAPYGYAVPDRLTKVRDKLDKSANTTTAVNHIKPQGEWSCDSMDVYNSIRSSSSESSSR